MVRIGADVVHVGRYSGVGACGAGGVYRVDVEAGMVGAIGVMVEVGSLEDGDLCIAGSLRAEANGKDERGEKGSGRE